MHRLDEWHEGFNVKVKLINPHSQDSPLLDLRVIYMLIVNYQLQHFTMIDVYCIVEEKGKDAF